MTVKCFQIMADAWNEPDRLKRMQYTILHLVFRNEICLAEKDGVIVVANNVDGKYVIPVWPSCTELDATFAKGRSGIVARIYSKKTFETEILGRMQDDELIAVFPDQNLQYEQLDRDEMAQAIEFVTKQTSMC